MDDDVTTALATLQSAVSRMPTDSAVKAELALAFVAAGAGQAAAAVAATMSDVGGLADVEVDTASGENGRALLRAAQLRALRRDYSGAASLARRAMNATKNPLTESQRRQASGLQGEHGG
jgi:hypothetical protein